MERSRLRLPVEQSKSKSDSIPMSSKQLYSAVKNGQRITFHPFDADTVTGYLAGLDDEHFFVLEPTHDGFEPHLLRRAMVPDTKIHRPYNAFADEKYKEEMDEIIHKFRTWVMRNVFGQQKSRNEAEINLEGAAR